MTQRTHADGTILLLEQMLVALDIEAMVSASHPGVRVWRVESPTEALAAIKEGRPKVVIASLSWLGAHAGRVLDEVKALGSGIVTIGSFSGPSACAGLARLDYPLRPEDVAAALDLVIRR